MAALLTMLATVLSTLGVIALGVFARAPAALAAPSTDPRPVRVVVLVDESGSLSDAGVSAERDAAALIVQSEFSPLSEMAVVGFGSSNKPGQSPVDDVCALTKVDTTLNRDYLSHCVAKLHRRTTAEGNDTDYANAFVDALSIMGSADSGQQRIVFMLTDGNPDVRNSPGWGGRDATPEQRDEAARQEMNADLAKLKDGGVQVWPLGFGDPNAIDRSRLADLAARGSQATCSSSAPKPSAVVVTGASDVRAQLFKAFGAARCGNVEPPSTDHLATGTTVNLAVTIPVISTDGSIAVIKTDPRIVVSYFAPGEDSRPVPKAGVQDGATYSVSGESSPVEVLRIRNPKPGKWRVQLSSGPDVAPQDVSATVVWQGNVQSSVTVSPPRPQAGTPVTVQLTIRHPRRRAHRLAGTELPPRRRADARRRVRGDPGDDGR